MKCSCLSFLISLTPYYRQSYEPIRKQKKIAIAFYQTAYNGDPRKAIELYVGKEYIQHNPSVADGTKGFIAYFENMKLKYPEKTIEFVRSIAE